MLHQRLVHALLLCQSALYYLYSWTPPLGCRYEFKYAGKIRDLMRDSKARCALIEYDRQVFIWNASRQLHWVMDLVMSVSASALSLLTIHVDQHQRQHVWHGVQILHSAWHHCSVHAHWLVRSSAPLAPS
jgi:hypothetical protein